VWKSDKVILTGNNKELGKQVPVPHCPPKIWKGLARDGTQQAYSAVRGRPHLFGLIS